MNRLKNLFALVFVVSLITGLTSCESDEPGSWSSHDYYSALVETADLSYYYWVIDMNPKGGSGYDGTFKIQAWTIDGKKMSDKTSYSGKYQTSGSTIYVTWDHQSLNTLWKFTSDGIEMVDGGGGNPTALVNLTFYKGAPSFK